MAGRIRIDCFCHVLFTYCYVLLLRMIRYMYSCGFHHGFTGSNRRKTHSKPLNHTTQPSDLIHHKNLIEERSR